MKKLARKGLSWMLALCMTLSLLPMTAMAADDAAPTEGKTPAELLAAMTLDQKIGQMIMPDFRKWKSTGASLEANVTEINDEIVDIIDKYDFGGVILFAENVVGTEQTRRLTTQLQSAALKDKGEEGAPAIPMFLTIDQEGGIVYRLGTGTALPGNMAIGATRSAEMAEQVGQIIGRELNSLGINVNFAPSVDVNNNPLNPVIGLRSVSSDPNLVAQLTVPMIRGMNEYNIASAAKHFPGHGDTANDSHSKLPVVDKSFDQLKATELVPFKAAVEAGVDMLMTAHIAYPQIDDTTIPTKADPNVRFPIPCTLSKTVIKKLAREYLNYDGVIVTDAMNMAAISDNIGQAQAVVMVFQAGIDIALMPVIPRTTAQATADLDAVFAAVKKAINDGELTIAQIDKSVTRILELKKARGLLDAEYPAENSEAFNAQLAAANAQVGSKQNRKLERDIAAAAITVVKNENNLLPIKPKAGETVLFFTPYDNEVDSIKLGVERAKADGAIPSSIAYEVLRTDYNSSFTGTLSSALKAKLDTATYVVVVSETTAAGMGGGLGKYVKAVTAYTKTKNIPSVVATISQPYDLANYPDATALLAAFGAKGIDPTEAGNLFPVKAFGPNLPAAVEVILGNYGASGKLPVDLPAVTANKIDLTKPVAYPFGAGIELPYYGPDVKGLTPEQILHGMTLDQKIGQKIMPSFRSWKVTGASAATNLTAMNEEVAEIVDKYDFGGVIFFRENTGAGTEPTYRLVSAFQQAARKDEGKESGMPAIPMLTAIDQEGGIVYRLPSGTYMPGNMALGATRSTEMAKQTGEVFGRELSALGFNTNWAPVMDVNNNPLNPVIGVRSFSSDPNLVAQMGIAYIEGLHDYNLITSLKHFPGHGDTATDSHFGLPSVDKSLEQLKANELVPFKAAVEAGADMLMTAHIVYPQIDPDAPATMSRKVIDTLARQELGFEGVIVTDSLGMAGASDVGATPAEKVTRCFRAGVDIALMPTAVQTKAESIRDFDAIVAAVKKDITDGKLTMEELDKSVLRILKAKKDRGILGAEYPAEGSEAFNAGLDNAKAEVGSKQNRKLEREISAAAITLVKNEGNMLPLKPKAGEHILFLTPYSNEVPGIKLGIERAKADGTIDKSVTYDIDYVLYDDINPSVVSDALKVKIEKANYVVITSETSGQNLNGWASIFPRTVTAYTKSVNIPTVVISINQPYDIANYPDAPAIMAAYGAIGMDPTDSLEPENGFGPNIPAAIEVTLGNYEPQGKLPVDIPRVENGAIVPGTIAYPIGFGLSYAHTTTINGSVVITGTAELGQTLTADVSGVTPADAQAVLTYQWYRGDAPIQDATGSTYAPVRADIGETIKVVVTGTEDYEGSLTSAPTAAVTEGGITPTDPYIITFVADGQTVETRTVEHGDDLPMSAFPAVPAKTGYTGAWDKAEDFTNVTENATVTAVYTANSYTVTFEPNGGIVDPESKTVTYDQAYGILPTPTHSDTDMIFEGWFTEGGAKVEETTLVTIADDHALYARWRDADTSPSPAFEQSTQTFVDADALTVTFTLTGAAADTYKVYAAAEGGEALADPTVSVEGTVLTLTFTAQPLEETTYYISATEDGKAESARTQVIVKPYQAPSEIAVTGVELDRSTMLVRPGNQIKLAATVLPEEASNKAVTWSSSNSAVATVDETGLVTGVADGTATITVKTMDGDYTADCVVTVETYVYIPPTTKTETRKNGDGSTTKIVTNLKTGTVTETTTWPDGTKIVTTTGKDGASTSEVTVPKDKDSVTVTIPTVQQPGPGQVAVIVKPDGTREIVKTSVATEDGMRVTLTEGAKLEIIDNSKRFIDVETKDWFDASVQFVASRELFTGTSANTFSPDAPTSRAMLMTVLARLDGQDTAVGETWDSVGMAWARENGISDGNNGESGITREQLALMLYRYAKAEKPTGGLDAYLDAGQVSAWAAEAMAWAVEQGIIQGAAGRLNPTNTATRAEVAAMLERFVKR